MNFSMPAVSAGRHLLTACAAFGLLALMPSSASAVACAKGVYRAGCAGPNGAVAVKKPPQTACVNGVYRAGCTGPNGTAVIRKYGFGAREWPVKLSTRESATSSMPGGERCAA
jgi:hypothetical protein